MKINENDIIQFIEPIFYFCLKRLSNRHDAEDLSNEILLHVIAGLGKYEIESLEGWVWRIAHNRYARFIDARNKKLEIVSDEILEHIADDYCMIDESSARDEFETVFAYLHTLAADYKNILVDYYMGGMSVKEITEKYNLTESTIKWRLNIGRQRIRDRIGENKMDKVYKRINWNTGTCNGLMNVDAYLHSQISRAICEAAYEMPVTVEEISLKTGIPTMYIEDELPRLIYADAMEQIGKKYATNFIVLRLNDRKIMETKFLHYVHGIADYFDDLLKKGDKLLARMDFYGAEFSMKRLGYIAIPAILRNKVKNIMEKAKGFEIGQFPPRKDGGFGWFIVEETEDERELMGEYSSGCNITGGKMNHIYYFHIAKYFDYDVYHDGMQWLSKNNIIEKCHNGVIPEHLLSREDIIRLLKVNLIVKCEDGYKLNFACFTRDEYAKFIFLFNEANEIVDKQLRELIYQIHSSFKAVIPKRLDSQINQWVSGYVHSIIGYVIDELINRCLLEIPNENHSLANGVFYIKGEYVKV